MFGSRKETVDKALAKLKEENADWEVDGMFPKLTDAAEVEKAVLDVKEKFGKVDILVNNAGISQSTPLYDYTPEEYDPVTGLSKLVNFPALEDLAKYDVNEYKYLDLLGDDYVKAMQSAYDTYASGGSMTPNEKEVVNAVLDLVIPAGVESVEEGLIYKKSQGTHPTKTVTAYSLVTIEAGEEVTNEDDGTVTLTPGTGTFAGCSSLTGIYLNQAPDGSVTVPSSSFVTSSPASIVTRL